MNLQSNPLLSSSSDPAAQTAQLQTLLRQFAQQVNNLTNGKASAITNASTVAPADGTGNPGDFVAKQGAVASGPVGAQYVVIGWRCVATGSTPATQWVEVLETVRVPPSSTPAPTPAPTSAPSPTPAPPYSLKIQAENATLHNIAVVTTIAGYEGTGHADWFRSGYDEYIEFSFTGSPTASGNLTLRYANYGDQTITVLLNGATTGTMYTFTNSGGTWATKVIPGVSFNSGTNTVRLIPEYSGYTYTDYAQFDQTTGAPPPPPPAPSPTPAPPSAPAPSPAPGSAPFYPFGSRLDLTSGAYPHGIQVTGYTTTQLDAAVKACYDKWKLNRLAKSPSFVATDGGIFSGQTITDGYHVQWADNTNSTRSEGIGYGMLICVLMAHTDPAKGDPNAQTYFNGMFRVARGRPAFGMSSTGGANVYLMNYKLLPDMSSAGDPYSAADGDMDIALALLMAHRQWGSSGTYNYYQEALNTINALKAADFYKSPGTSANGVMFAPQNVSRTSDYMAGHFRSFKAATNDSFWDDARTNSLALVQKVTNNYSPSAHLQPGFIYDPLGPNPRPDTVAHIDRSMIEQIYDENAVRNPWRWGTDYVWSGDTAWQTLAKNIVTQIQTSSGGSASGLTWAYNLDGSPYQGGLYHDGMQAGCVMAGCVTDSGFQTFLNTLYAANIGSGYDIRYFYAELMLLPLIVVTGNWWLP